MGQIIHVIFSVSVRRRCGLERSPVQHFNIAPARGARIDRDVAALHGVRRHRLDLLLDRLAADRAVPARVVHRLDDAVRDADLPAQLADRTRQQPRLKFALVRLEGADIVENLAVAAVVGERVVLRDDRQQDRIRHAVRYVEVCADRVAHRVDISQTSERERDPGEQRADEHILGRLDVLAARDKAADVAAEQLHRLFRHRVRERRRRTGNIGLLRMDEGVDAAGRRDARRCARQQLRVQNGAGRQQLIAEYSQLVVTPVVGDDRERRDLRAGACRGRDGDERHDLARNLVRALIFLDPAAVFDDNADRLGDIHRRAAAEGHDKIRARRLVGRRRLFDRIRRRIALGLGEGVDRKACRRERVRDLAHQPHLCQMRAGNDKCVRAAELLCGLGQLRERAAAHHDILRNGKAEIVHNKHSSTKIRGNMGMMMKKRSAGVQNNPTLRCFL